MPENMLKIDFALHALLDWVFPFMKFVGEMLSMDHDENIPSEFHEKTQ